jgi:phospholipase C
MTTRYVSALTTERLRVSVCSAGEPDYYDCPIHLQTLCDNHPPLAMAPREAFLGQVYKSLTSNAARWARTALIVTYDEHGGFFDHIAPLAVKYRNPAGVSFDSTGPRVPAIVAGPFASQGVSQVTLDNTSILQLLAERFGRPGEVYSSTVAGRAATMASVSAVLSATAANAAIASVASSLPPAARYRPRKVTPTFVSHSAPRCRTWSHSIKRRRSPNIPS